MPESFIPREFTLPSLWLTDPNQGSTALFYLLIGDLFGLLLTGGLVAYFLAPRLMKRHRIRIRLFRQLMGWIATIGALGLFWVFARMLGAPLFARPLWLYFTFIALFAVLAYHAYYWRRRYPVEINAYEQQIRRRRWMPTQHRGSAPRSAAASTQRPPTSSLRPALSASNIRPLKLDRPSYRWSNSIACPHQAIAPEDVGTTRPSLGS